MLPGRPFSAVNERDVDMLLLEEFKSSSAFRSWWLERMGYAGAEEHKLRGAWRSVSDAGDNAGVFGESDLVLVVTNASGLAYAVLIEDKIDARPGPNAAGRYKERGERGTRNGSWADFITCIVAPEAYLSAIGNVAGYDRKVSYESVGTWFANCSLPADRTTHKRELLRAAIEGANPKNPLVPEPAVTAFLADYWEIASHFFPGLMMPHPGPGGPKSRWIYFASPAPGRRLVHKLDDGYVDLLFVAAHSQLERLTADNQAILNNTIHPVVAGKSAAFRVFVTKIDYFGQAIKQLGPIREGLEAARMLRALSPAVVVLTVGSETAGTTASE